MTADATGRVLARRLAAAAGSGRQVPADLRVVEGAFPAAASTAGAFAFGLEHAGTRVADAYVHPDRVRVEFLVAPDVAAASGERAGLRVRPKAVRPARTLVFVESREEVVPALRTVAAVCDAVG